MSQWSKFRDFINSTPIGQNITRQEALFHVYENRGQWKGYSRQTTIDSYRLTLTRLNILESICRGIYKVNHHIREDISFESIKRLAYPKRSWQEWFIPANERIKGVIK